MTSLQRQYKVNIQKGCKLVSRKAKCSSPELRQDDLQQCLRLVCIIGRGTTLPKDIVAVSRNTFHPWLFAMSTTGV